MGRSTFLGGHCFLAIINKEPSFPSYTTKQTTRLSVAKRAWAELGRDKSTLCSDIQHMAGCMYFAYKKAEKVVPVVQADYLHTPVFTNIAHCDAL